MTVGIASFQRRPALLRLLASLAEDLAQTARAADDIDVVVVLDGSTDGSREAVEDLEFPVPLTVHWQEHRGLAAARNACIAASGELLWFLDDDLVVPAGLASRHLAAHASPARRIVLGPCRIPEDWPTIPELRSWWDHRYGHLATSPLIRQFDHVSLANASGPTEVYRALGGLDEEFGDFGYEDYELGYRALEAGVTVEFDAGAVAWHYPTDTLPEYCMKRRAEGASAVTFLRRHPDAAPVVGQIAARPLQLLRFGRTKAVMSALTRTGIATRALHRGRQLALYAAFATGLADADSDGAVRRLMRGNAPLH
jgi:glycosyltransferase involved in cell wall biosynthesis